jgi:hypothetical protein
VTDDATSAEAPDPAILRAERRLRMLEELADIGMNLARALERQALAAADPAEPAAPDASADPAGAYARISRAVRLTLALEARTDEALRALRAGVAAESEVRRDQARRRATAETVARRQARQETVERLVCEAAEREIEDDQAMYGVLKALEERLDDDPTYVDLARLPLRETVERLCADLQLTPDWSRWEGEGWTPEEPFFRPKASIWRRPSRKPLSPDPTSQSEEVPAPRAHALE